MPLPDQTRVLLVHYDSILFSAALAVCVVALIASSGEARAESDEALLVPDAIVIDGSISTARKEAMSLAARRYYTFWNTGDVSYAQAALAPGLQLKVEHR